MEKTDLDRAGFICHGLTVFFGQADNIALAADFQKNRRVLVPMRLVHRQSWRSWGGGSLTMLAQQILRVG